MQVDRVASDKKPLLAGQDSFMGLLPIIKFGRHRPSFLESQKDFLFLIIFLRQILLNQFTSNRLQTFAQ